MIQSEEKRSELRELLDRYVSVWLWSILFGSTSGVAYTLLSLRSSSWGKLGAVFLFPAAMVFACATLAWLHLYRGLRCYLLPTFLPMMRGEADPLRFGISLRQAFYFLFLAFVFRISTSLLELALGVLSGPGSSF
jgi:hypothetical protein